MSKVCEFCGKHAVAGHSINVCSRCLKSGKIARS